MDSTVAQGKRMALRAMIAGVLGSIMAIGSLVLFGLEGRLEHGFSLMSLAAIVSGAVATYSLQTSWQNWRILRRLEIGESQPKT